MATFRIVTDFFSMNWIKALQKRTIKIRATDEQVYALVLKEIESGKRSDGLWAKAMADSNGNSDKAKSIYIKYRAVAIKDEVALEKSREGASESKASPKSKPENSRTNLKPANKEQPWSNNYTLILVGIAFIVFLFTLSW